MDTKMNREQNSNRQETDTKEKDRIANGGTGQRRVLLTLFLSVLKISACTFGGGFVIVPLMRRKFVEELHWIEEEEMLDLVSIAQSSPGAIAVNASTAVGYHIAGVRGALTAILGTVIPPVTIISIISLFYQAFRDNRIVRLVMAGMLCGVAAVIFDVVVDMAKEIIRKKRALPVIVMAAAFAAVRYLGINIIVIILASGLIGAADMLCRNKKGGERS